MVELLDTVHLVEVEVGVVEVVVLSALVVVMTVGVTMLLVDVVLCRGQSVAVGLHSVMVLVMVLVEVRVVVPSMCSAGGGVAMARPARAMRPVVKRIVAEVAGMR